MPDGGAGAETGTATPPVRVDVRSECGHTWTETRPAGIHLPSDGELRACAHPDCYPRQFPVTYANLTELPGGGAG